jgi:outer membrane lipoprotein-sorting protein
VVAAAMVKGAAAGGSLSALTKGTLKLMAWTKVKMGVGIGVAVLLAATGVYGVHRASASRRANATEIVGKSEAAYAALSGYSDSGIVTWEAGNQGSATTFTTRLQRPNLYRLQWTQTGGTSTGGGTVWSAGKGDFMVTTSGEYEGKQDKYKNIQSAWAAAMALSGQASSIAATFFKQSWGNVLSVNMNFKKQQDETVGGVDCFVLSTFYRDIPAKNKMPSDKTGKLENTTTLWIGKHDYLIHKIRNETITAGASGPLMPDLNDAEITAILVHQNKPVTPEAIAERRAEIDTANKSFMKPGKYVFIQTYENISLNPALFPSDFER